MKKIISIFLSLLIFSGIDAYAYGFGYKKNNNHEIVDIGSYEKEIEDTNSYYVGQNDSVLYLTFDVGYDNGNLEKILEILDEKGVKATFFVTGDFVNRNKDLLQMIISYGHSIGNHTYSHKNITKLSKDEIISEVQKLEKAYNKVTNQQMLKVFRPPEGQFDKRSLNVIKDLGYKTIFWSVAYDDWNTNKQKGKEYAYKKITDNLHNGAIILMHTVSTDNVEALSMIIDKAISDGYTFLNLEDIK